MYRKPKQPGFMGAFPWGPVATFFGTIVLGNWCSTQYAALHYTNLGAPLFLIMRRPVYAPFKWATWLYHGRLMPGPERMPLVWAMIGSLMSIVLAFALARILSGLRLRRLSSGGEDLHGSSRFAKREDLETAGLIDQDDGLLVGGFVDGGMINYLRHRGPQSVIAIAPPGSGKSVALVVPVLLEHKANIVVYDTKGELWQATAGYRSKELGHRCLKFAPVEEDSDGYNPFAEIRVGTPHEVADALNIIKMMVRRTVTTSSNEHWYSTAECLGLGMALHQCYVARNAGRTATPLDIYNGLTPDGMTLKEYLKYCLTYEHDVDGSQGWVDQDGEAVQTHPEVRRHFTQQLNRSDEEFDSVVSTLSVSFMVFTDPLVARATSHSSFRMTELMSAEDPISLYLVVPPSDRERLEPLFRLLFTQVIQRNTESMDYNTPSVSPNDRLLLMIDEAGSLGHMKALADALTFIRGYHIQAYLIFHSVGQIFEHYGNNNAMLGSTHVKIAFVPNTKDTAEFLSEMTGKTTVMRANHSFSGNRGAVYGLKTVSSQVDYVARPLMTADEIMRLRSIEKTPDGGLDPGEMLIFVAGQYPILGTQTPYIALPEFRRRSRIEPPQHQAGELQSTLASTLERLVGGSLAARA